MRSYSYFVYLCIYLFIYFSLPGLVLQYNLAIQNVCQHFGITQRPISGQVELKLHSGITPDLGGGGEGARGASSLTCCIGMSGPKLYDFLAALVLNRVWFVHSSLELGMFFRRSGFFVIWRYER